ncbi:DUF3084 domain-containing protein [Synechococcus sp. W65.1]|uniref:DUF3084 domain-containing protein n=1 Tax=unclassified Synechococcus TaxID=2626047 RepID=UPI0039C04E51
MQGVLLILYMLFVSGLIAVVGDRVGYRIGKKRLTWFNLRPRHTAILVAVITGVSISALTLGTLLLLNRSLSEALFSYTNQIARARQELQALNRQKAWLETENAALRAERDRLRLDLDRFRSQQSAAQTRLSEVQDQLAAALQARQEAEAKLAATQEQLAQVQPKLEQAQVELAAVKREVESAQQTIATLKSQKQTLQLDRDQLERSLEAAQAALNQLETQKNQLEGEIAQLSQLAVRLRRGELAILAGEVLATGVVQTPAGAKPETVRQQFEQLLAQAEQRALALGSQPIPPLENAILIRREDADRALKKLQEAGSWAVRILSLTNRLKGEPVPVVVQIYPNQRLFAKGSVLAQGVIQPGLSESEIQQRLLELLNEANQRSQEKGLLADPITGTVGEFSQVKFLEVVQQLRQSTTPLDVKLVADADIYTAGPLRVSFLMAQASSQHGPAPAQLRGRREG